MRAIQVVAILIGAGLLIAAYYAPEKGAVGFLGGSFFLLMAYLSIKNKGAIDSPFLYFALSAVSLFYCFGGLIDGEYARGGLKYPLDQKPTAFWLTFTTTLFFGLGTLIYGLRQFRKGRRA